MEERSIIGTLGEASKQASKQASNHSESAASRPQCQDNQILQTGTVLMSNAKPPGGFQSVRGRHYLAPCLYSPSFCTLFRASWKETHLRTHELNFILYWWVVCMCLILIVGGSRRSGHISLRLRQDRCPVKPGL